MRQPNSPLPTVILVPPPAKKPRRRIKLPLFKNEIPWIKIAIYGSLAWVGILAGTAFFFAIQPETQRLDDIELLAARPARPAEPARPVEPAKPKVEQVREALAVLPCKNEFVECARIGTQVRFMKEPADAFQRARNEKKMVFMVHLSGNLEDQEFT